MIVIFIKLYIGSFKITISIIPSTELITSDGITSDSQTSMSDIMRRDTIRRQRRDLTSSVADIVNSIQSIRRKRYSEYPKYPQYPTYSGYMSYCQKFVQMLKDVMACPAPDQGYGYGAVNTSTYGYGGYTTYTIQCSPACNEKLCKYI